MDSICRLGQPDFYPRPPRGGRRRSISVRASSVVFLSTPSARRATGLLLHGGCPLCNFYPRPPRGGRPFQRLRLPFPGTISIHALREEGDANRCAQVRYHRRFLSTPSARRATSKGMDAATPDLISIHALREEGDTWHFAKRPLQMKYFYPRPPRGGRHKCRNPEKRPSDFYPRPPRGGRPSAAQGENRPKIFLSTPSARRATINLL